MHTIYACINKYVKTITQFFMQRQTHFYILLISNVLNTIRNILTVQIYKQKGKNTTHLQLVIKKMCFIYKKKE